MGEHKLDKYELQEIVERVLQEYDELADRMKFTDYCTNKQYLDDIKDGVFALQEAINQWLEDHEELTDEQ